MTKAPIKISEYFVLVTDDEGNEVEVIFHPPLLAESENIRVELRKELNHHRPHVHIIKKGRVSSFDVSIALDDLTVLAGGKNVKHFEIQEYQKIQEFLAENADRFYVIYEKLRGEL